MGNMMAIENGHRIRAPPTARQTDCRRPMYAFVWGVKTLSKSNIKMVSLLKWLADGGGGGGGGGRTAEHRDDNDHSIMGVWIIVIILWMKYVRSRLKTIDFICPLIFAVRVEEPYLYRVQTIQTNRSGTEITEGGNTIEHGIQKNS